MVAPLCCHSLQQEEKFEGTTIPIVDRSCRSFSLTLHWLEFSQAATPTARDSEKYSLGSVSKGLPNHGLIPETSDIGENAASRPRLQCPSTEGQDVSLVILFMGFPEEGVPLTHLD